MTVTPFNKKPPKDLFVKRGLVVLLNSDEDEAYPMTTSGEVRDGKVCCRWHGSDGALQEDWFYPEELYRQASAEVVDFQPEFDLNEKGESAK